MATKIVNGVVVVMSPAEEAQFVADGIPTVAQLRASKLQAVLARWAKAEDRAVLIGKANITGHQTAMAAKAKSIATAIAIAGDLAALNAIDVEAGGWE